MKMGKRITAAAVLSAMLMTSFFASFAKEAKYEVKNSDFTGGAFSVKDEVGTFIQENGYFGFKGVNLTEIKSVTVNAFCNNLSDGDLILVRIDSPTGRCIGRVDINTGDGYADFTASLEATSGAHDVYFMSLMSAMSTYVKSVTFKSEAYEYKYEPVSEAGIIDKKQSTWALTDALGRRMADYEEVGPIKEGKQVGIFYWTWHKLDGEPEPVNNTEFAKLHPEAKYDYNNPVWPTGSAVYYWNEPLFGYYTGADYWVMRKHALMLGDAGVDAIFFDCTNGKSTYRYSYNVLFDALRDCMKAGNEVPKVAFVSNLSKSNADAKYNIMRIYFGAYHDGKYSDLWYKIDGKPVIMAHPDQLKAEDDAEAQAIMTEIKEFFTFKYPMDDHEAGSLGENEWGWLRTFGNTYGGKRADGSYEMATVGVAVNRSYETGKIDAMNTPFVMGRRYSSGLGDDKSEGAEKYGYFFREQLSAALAENVDFMFVTGWNEWKASRHVEWNTTKNAFPDQYDDNGSRDMEPTKGELKDIYYCLLVDAVRRFKGAEAPEAASEEKTVDFNDASAWNDVAPEYFNDRGTYKRDSIGFGKTHYKNETMRNNPVYMKAARDAFYIYFMAEAEDALKGDGEASFMNLYINSDRNYMTGWEGYDFVIKNGKAYALSATGEMLEKGDCEQVISGKTIQIKAERELLGLSGTLDFEFKWVDNCVADDVTDFYVNGNAAPMGRFNYRYTEKKASAPTVEERSALSGISLIKAGSAKMLVSGAKSDLSENDPTSLCVEMNGTAYIPYNALTKILGLGRCKVEYNADYNIAFVYHFDSDGHSVGKYTWVGSVVGSLEARVNGVAKPVSAPVIAYGGTVYIPVTMLSECFDIDVTCVENGLYAIGENIPSDVGAYSKYFN